MIINKLLYYVLRAVVWMISILPMRLLYVLSDALYILVYRCIGYRVKLVKKHLADCFPEKTHDERLCIERQYYHWFCDYIVETLKMFTISDKNMAKRMRFEGLELVNECVARGQSVGLYLGHYCNWEWITSIAARIQGDFQPMQVYHPLENKAMDDLMLYGRSRFKGMCVDMDDTLRVFSQHHRAGKAFVVGLIADQVPWYHSMHCWVDFLHHNTPTFSGSERLIRMFDMAAFYLDIERPCRGYYVAHVKKITDSPKEMEKFAIIKEYFRMLEETIKRNPPYWLWTHNRWKRDWEGFCKEYPDPKERERIMSKL